MSDFTQHSLENLEQLCKIRCTPEEEKEFLHNLQKFLDYVEQLNEVNTDEVESCNHILKNIQEQQMREDIEGDTLSTDLFLSNAPQHVAGLIQVPSIIKSES